jgi:hypothetical protein
MNDITIDKSPSYGENMIKWAFILSRNIFLLHFCSVRFMSLDFFSSPIEGNFRNNANGHTKINNRREKIYNPLTSCIAFIDFSLLYVLKTIVRDTFFPRKSPSLERCDRKERTKNYAIFFGGF